MREQRPFLIYCAVLAIGVATLAMALIHDVASRQPRARSVTFNAPDRSLVRQVVELVIDQRLSERMARSWYPELSMPGSAMAEAYTARESAMRDSDDTTLDDPDYPMNLAIEIADSIGIKPSKPTIIIK